MRVSLLGLDNLLHDIEAVIARSEPGPDATLMREVLPVIPVTVRGLVCAALLAAGRRSLSVEAFAELVAMSPRKLERILHDTGAPRPETILHASMALYATYRLERQRPEKRVRAAMQYQKSRQGFSKLLYQYTGKRPGMLGTPGSFAAALQRTVELFRGTAAE